MAGTTSATGLLFEAKPRWSGTIGSGGVAAAGTTTIPLSSAANLDNGDAYIAVINRVTSDGTKNSLADMETFIGELSGTNFINCVRGVEGTAQAWDAGKVVEILFTAAHWNKMIDAFTAEHSPDDGTHTDAVVTTLKASGAEVDTGTSDVKIVTPKAIADSTVTTPTKTQTFTNKRITKRVTTITSHATPTVNTDNCDVVTITAQAEDITSMTTNLSGTPTNFQTLVYRILDNGSARAITWGASFQAMGVDLPTTTTANKVLTVGFIYDTVDSKWGCVASVEEA